MKKYLFLLLAISLIGCTLYRIDSQDSSDDFYAAKESIDQVVYQETIQKPHTIIGYVVVNAERNQNMDEILEKMRREAGIMGGDVITNVQSDATGAWKSLPIQQTIGNAYVRANFKASVAVFK